MEAAALPTLSLRQAMRDNNDANERNRRFELSASLGFKATACSFPEVAEQKPEVAKAGE